MMSQPSEPSNESLIRRLIRLPAWAKITALSLVGLGVAAVAVYMVLDSQPIISKQATEGATFPVYVPTKTPAGYVVEPVKTSLTSDMLTYTFVPDSNKDASNEIVVTVQPLPKDFNMTKLIGSGSVTTTTTNNGTLYDLSTSKKSQYLLNTGDALIFFTSAGSIDTLTINSLVADLVKQK